MNGATFEFTARERRLRLLYVSADLLMNVLLSPQRQGNELRWLTVDGVPSGAEVEAVWWCEYRAAFCLRLWHESFDVVESGAEIPVIYLMIGVRIVPLCKTCLDEAPPGG